MKIEINYNTISFKSDITCNDKIVFGNLQQTIKEVEDKRITIWFEEFINKINEIINKEYFSIKVIGCDCYESEVITSILENKKNIHIEKKIVDNQVLIQRHNQIDRFFNYVLNSNEKIIKEGIAPHKKNLSDLQKSMVSIPVIASMSSGKSTLLNALIGQDFLHEDQGATTATTCTIYGNDNEKHYKATIFENDKIKEITESNIQDFIAKWNKAANNESKNIHLKLEGSIPNIQSSDFKLAFVDTPGPNSSNYSQHKEKTYTYLRENEKLPIILYVLDLEKIDSNDDDLVIKEISDVFKSNKQSLDRIIFVVNKIDRVDVEVKSMDVILNMVKDFLKKYEIENPIIFPVSAYYAKLAQIDTLTRKQTSDLETVRSIFTPNLSEDYKAYELVKYSSLSENEKSELLDRLEKSDNQKEKDLILSGLNSIQYYIQDYILNHHKKIKYNELNNISNTVYDFVLASIEFGRKDHQGMFNSTESKNKQDREAGINRLDLEFEGLKSEVNKLEVNRNEITKSVYIKVDTELNREVGILSNKGDILKSEAEKALVRVNEIVENLEISIKTQLESDINDYMRNYVDNLKKLAISRFKNKEIGVDFKLFSSKMTNSITSMKVEMLQEYERIDRKVKTREVRSKWLFKRLFNYTDTEVYTYNQSYVNFTEIYNKHLSDLNSKFRNIIEEMEKELENQMINKKTTFLSSVDNLYTTSKKEVFNNFDMLDSKDKRKLEENITFLDNLQREVENIKNEAVLFSNIKRVISIDNEVSITQRKSINPKVYLNEKNQKNQKNQRR